MSKPPSQAPPQPKTAYRAYARLERFYTGADICVAPDESTAACACGEEVKVSHLLFNLNSVAAVAASACSASARRVKPPASRIAQCAT